MAYPNNLISSILPSLHFEAIFVSLLLLFLPSHTKSLNFSFSNFRNKQSYIDTEDDSFVGSNGEIQLTKTQQGSSLGSSVGRASYNKPLRLWDTTTKELTDFTTRFSFRMTQPDHDVRNAGDGITFFLAAPFSSSASSPHNSTGGCLGLISGDYCNITSSKDSQFVAVEFDSYPNVWDPFPYSHVGIDVNSVDSVAFIGTFGLENVSEPSNAQITYDSSNTRLSVSLTYSNDSPVFLSHIIDLRTYLPDTVRVGFTASTGMSFEIHNILSWEFHSTLEDAQPLPPAPQPEPEPASNGLTGRKSKSKVGLVGVVSGFSVLLIGLGLVGFMWWRRRSLSPGNDDVGSDLSDDFESGTGPRRFAYGELSRATEKFSEERKLGEGGFGGVYLGFLADPYREIAVKKVSRGSRQGKKEFMSEVKIISRLRHKNLVQLFGWCHELGDLLLVYEFMSNGSLDSHLYGGKKDALSWTLRYKIALGLASSMVYLHEEWEQCVVHRDIKSSNVMLDSNFNAKLGDFGLARLVDHELGSQTTALAGTLGYLAPECAVTGQASKESDVYSFGVVALEIVCGRRPFEPREEPNKVRMIEWVWDIYGKGHLLEAIDQRLEGEFDAHQAECLMMVGLWCCHPDYTFRPSISQAIKVLKSEAPLPLLPSTFPVPTYSSTPMRMNIYSIPTSSGFSGSSGATTSSSSQSLASGSAPLLSEKSNV